MGRVFGRAECEQCIRSSVPSVLGHGCDEVFFKSIDTSGTGIFTIDGTFLVFHTDGMGRTTGRMDQMYTGSMGQIGEATKPIRWEPVVHLQSRSGLGQESRAVDGGGLCLLSTLVCGLWGLLCFRPWAEAATEPRVDPRA
jgi:hypothetical protein